MSRLLSYDWWLSVVVVGIAINIISSYIKPIFDKLLSKVSSNYRIRTANAEKERLLKIQILSEDKDELTFALHEETRSRIMALFFLVIGIFAHLWPKVGELEDTISQICFLCGMTFLYFTSAICLLRADRLEKLIKEARRK